MKQTAISLHATPCEVAKRFCWLAVTALGLIVLVAAAVRLFALDQQTLSHDEAFVPGLELPRDFVDVPLPRFTLWQVLKGCLGYEEHPPLYYVVMLAWTKLFGTGIVALRMPSVVFGVASIPLVYLLGRREWGQVTGLVAAGMMAVNGHHIFWSQAARGCTLACFLGIASTLALLRINEVSRPLRGLFCYCVLVFLGLTADYYYWPIFAVQVLWVAGKSGHRAAVPQLLRWQFLIFVLASPLCAAAVHQSAIIAPLRGGNVLPYLSYFLQFGFLFEPDRELALGPLGSAAALILAVIALGLLVVGLASKSAAAKTAAVLPGPPVWLFLSAAFVALGEILAFAWYSSLVDGPKAMAVTATALIPVAMFFLDMLVRRYWVRFQQAVLQGRMILPDGVALSGLLAVVPIAMILVLASATPVFRSRWAMLYTSFLIVTVAQGFEVLVRRNRHWLALVSVLVAAHVLSICYFAQRPNSHWDFKALAEELVPRIQSTDLVFMPKPPAPSTALFYYLKAARYHMVGDDFSEALHLNPEARVWVVTWAKPFFREDYSLPEPMTKALQGYTLGEQIGVRGARAMLYSKRPNPCYQWLTGT